MGEPGPPCETEGDILAVIPARGGSKGVPGKNLRLVCGQPLIEYTIAAALRSRCRPRIVVSTDDPAIAEVARSAGAEVPFLRPVPLASDYAQSSDVVRHVLTRLEETEGYRPSAVLLLQPTSPLRTAQQIDEAVAMFANRGCGSVVSVSLTEHPPQWLRSIDADGMVRPVPGLQVSEGGRRQDLQPLYRLNGAIYVTSRVVLDGGGLLAEDTLAYVMPPEDSIDIDTELDLLLAELLLQRRRTETEGLKP